MNDPGLDKPISEDAKDVENQKKDEHDAEEEDEQAFLEPKYDAFFTNPPGGNM
jgi:potassium channel subfamily K